MKPPVFKRIPYKELTPVGTNDREFSGFDPKSMAGLAASIEQDGIVQPLIVHADPDGKGFLIDAGERRYTAVGALLEKKVKQTRGGQPLDEVPCMVFESAADAQVSKRLQLIENMQRSQLHGIEEARGLAQLSATMSIEEIAQQCGKSPAYVYGRIKLLAAPPEIQDAAIKGLLNDSVLLLLSRIPDKALAAKALGEVLDPNKFGMDNPNREPMSFRRAKEHVQNNYMVRLKGAPFDTEDATLVPTTWRLTGYKAAAKKDEEPTPIALEIQSLTTPIIPESRKARVGERQVDDGHGHKTTVCTAWEGGLADVGNTKVKHQQLLGDTTKAIATQFVEFIGIVASTPDYPVRVERICGGACGDCPFRTGNMQKSKLAPDIADGDTHQNSPDVCTLPTCFRAKKDAAFKRQAEKEKSKGNTLLKDAQAKKLFQNYGKGELYDGCGYIDLKAPVPNDRKERTWEEVLGDSAPDDGYTVATNPMTGKKHLLLPVDTARALLEKNPKLKGVTEELPAVREAGSTKETYEERRAREDAERARKCAHLHLAEPELVKALAGAALKRKADRDLWIHLLNENTIVRWAEATGYPLKTKRDQFGHASATEKEIQDFLDKATEEQLRACYLLRNIHRVVYEHETQWDDRVTELAEFLGLDLKAFAKRGQDLLKAQAEADKKLEAELAKLPGESFTIQYQHKDKPALKEANAQPVPWTLLTPRFPEWAKEFTWWLHPRAGGEGWTISEGSSGMALAGGETRLEAITDGAAKLAGNTLDKVRSVIKDALTQRRAIEKASGKDKEKAAAKK